MIEALKERRLMKKLAAINRETVPERAMFAKGAGARGLFQPYMRMSDYTAAAFLSDGEKKTPVFVRFSKGMPGGGETGRDVRGFAVRFYTEEGNYDLLSCSMPVFYIGNPMKFPQLVQSLKRERESNLRRPEDFFRFVADNPEALTMLLYLYSDGGTVKSYRHMPGYNVNTYRWVNGKGEAFLTRCSWMPLSGIRSIARQEAEFLAGFDEDVASRDLYETLREGQAIEYELSVQIVPEKNVRDFPFSLTDAAVPWPLWKIPAVRVGKLTLTHTINDYLNEVEKAAFTPGNLVKGIEFSEDPLLPVMAFAMEDGHRHRLGADYENLPVNQPILGEKNDEDDLLCSEAEAGAAAQKIEKTGSVDILLPARELYGSLCGDEKRRLEDNLKEDMMFLPEQLQKQMLRNLSAVDQELGKRIAKELAF